MLSCSFARFESYVQAPVLFLNVADSCHSTAIDKTQSAVTPRTSTPACPAFLARSNSEYSIKPTVKKTPCGVRNWRPATTLNGDAVEDSNDDGEPKTSALL